MEHLCYIHTDISLLDTGHGSQDGKKLIFEDAAATEKMKVHMNHLSFEFPQFYMAIMTDYSKHSFNLFQWAM